MKIQEQDKIEIQKAINDRLEPIESLINSLCKHLNLLSTEFQDSLIKSTKSIKELNDIFSYVDGKIEIDYKTRGTDLAGFPNKIIEWMLEQQFIQKGHKNINVLKKDRTGTDGFLWSNVKLPIGCQYTPESFCSEVIENKNFDLFYKVYPNN